MNRKVALLMLAVSLFSLLRLVHINADFAGDRADSAFWLTDEGWYMHAPAEQVLSGRWYQPGDLNAAIDVPVVPLLHYLPFKLFGVASTTARAFTALISIATIWLVFFLVRIFEPPLFAAVCCALLAASPFWFDYSRLALLEFPMMLFLLLATLALLRLRSDAAAAIVAGLLIVLAVLAKWMAIAILPALCLLVWHHHEYSRSALRRIIMCGVLSGALLAAYRITVLRSFAIDDDLFRHINIGSRVHSQPLFMSALRSLYHAHYVGIIFCVGSFLVLMYACFHVGWLRSRPLVLCSIVWWMGMLAALTFAHNQPSRYYQPLLIPTVFIFVTGAALLIERYRSTRVVVIGLSIFLAWNAAVDVIRIVTPRYSMSAMKRDIARKVADGAQPPMLLAHFACAVNLESRTPAVDSWYISEPLRPHLQRYKPTYYAAVDGNEPEVRRQLEDWYSLMEVGHYEVDGFPTIRLFRLECRRPGIVCGG